MKKTFFIPILAIAFSLCSCERKPDEGGGGDPVYLYLRSYIMTYYDFEALELTLSMDGEIIINEYPNEGVDGVLGSRNKWLGSYNSTGAMKVAYDALCEKHNDMEYNRDFVVFDGFGPHHTYGLGVDFTSIDIVSNADFDDEHPAGSSLGNIVAFRSLSLKPFIDSNYTIEGDTPERYTVIQGLLFELTPEQLVLLGRRYGDLATLSFEKEPTLSKTHTFTVTMTADDGRVFKDTVEMTFE